MTGVSRVVYSRETNSVTYNTNKIINRHSKLEPADKWPSFQTYIMLEESGHKVILEAVSN